MSEARAGDGPPAAARSRKSRWWQRGLPWLITAGCFVYLYSRLARAAALVPRSTEHSPS